VVRKVISRRNLMTIDELKEQIILLPEQLKRALCQEAEAKFKADSLADSIDKLREKLKEQNEENDEKVDEEEEDDNVELIKLESKHDRLKVKLDEAHGKAELKFRRDNPKATNEHVKAAVGTDSEVSRLRLELIDVKEESRIKKITLQREISDTRMKARRESWLRDQSEPESEELNRLEEEYIQAQREVTKAETEVKTVKAKLDAFKLLVQLEGLG
jgi:hypothetical protein